MTLLDWIIVVVWLGFALSGFWKGAVRIVFGLGGLAVGLWMALALGANLSIWLFEFIPVAWLAAVLGRVIPVLGCVLVFLVSGWGIERTLQAMRLGFLNRALGAVLAGCVGAVLLGIFMISASAMSAEFSAVAERSLLAPLLIDAWRALAA